MVTGVVFALLAGLCGVALNRALRAPLSLAPVSGLALIAVATTWCVALGVPPIVSTALVLLIAATGGVILAREPQIARWRNADRIASAVLAAAVIVPWLLLGIALASVDAPVSTHDGAFHVEAVDSLRRGLPVQGWYPMAFHSSVAAVLQLAPWLDSARGTVEAAQGLAILAPLGIFALGRAIKLSPRLAAIGALIQSLTYIYPYDDHMWGGWPLAMSIVLLLGLWSVAARWIDNPGPGLALLGGLLAGAIVLTHGTEVYSSVIGLAVVVVVRWRAIRVDKVLRYVPLAAVVAAVCAGPYLMALLHWAAGGGASAAGAEALADTTSQAETSGSGTAGALEFILGITGAGSFIDLPLRAVLLFVGARQRQLRLAFAAWLAFGALLFTVSFIDIEPVRKLYIITFPWLVHHRPPQLVVLFTSLLVGGGLYVAVAWFWSTREGLAAYAGTWRRLAIVICALLLFFGEGSSVSIFKTLAQVISQNNLYSADDRAAMAWLKQHAAADEMVVNLAASDAGIWAPYKAGLPVLLPRSASELVQETRGPILANLSTLNDQPALAQAACSLRADYVYFGSRSVDEDLTALPDRAELEHAPTLREVFSSGDTAIYQVTLACDQAMVAEAPSTR